MVRTSAPPKTDVKLAPVAVIAALVIKSTTPDDTETFSEPVEIKSLHDKESDIEPKILESKPAGEEQNDSDVPEQLPTVKRRIALFEMPPEPDSDSLNNTASKKERKRPPPPRRPAAPDITKPAEDSEKIEISNIMSDSSAPSATPDCTEEAIVTENSAADPADYQTNEVGYEIPVVMRMDGPIASTPVKPEIQPAFEVSRIEAEPSDIEDTMNSMEIENVTKRLSFDDTSKFEENEKQIQLAADNVSETITPEILDDSETIAETYDAVFYRTDPLLYHKWETFSVTKLIFSL